MATLARTLRILRDNNINVKWPKRNRTSDGWIGDEEHAQRSSDHNPNSRGIVDAIDVDSTTRMIGAVRYGIHVPTVIASMITHPATHYVIHNGRIMNRDDKYLPHRYNGTNRHEKHIHDSIRQYASVENSGTPYKFILAPMSWGLLKTGSTGQQVKELQAYLIGWGYGVKADGDYGSMTTAAVKAFQRDTHIGTDGIVGGLTRAKLRPFK